jgi:DNA-binding NtrC family response regulator
MAPYDVTVLLVGETGTGKELIARALHFLSPRASGPFVPADCAAIPETLFAHELFGHERGAFTDARETKLGLLAAASAGTLFLDEVESLSLTGQGTLLRLLDTHEWRPFGSHKWKSLDSRIVAATNEDLATLVQKGLFRRDLHYRLTVAICYLPPLRERREDIPLLARHYVSFFYQTFHRDVLTISEEALSLLCTHSWPGNIRELQNCLQHAVVHAAGPILRPSDLPLSIASPRAAEHSTASWQEARRQALAAWEKMYLAQTLQRKPGNLTQVARSLDLSRMQLYRLLKKYHLRPPRLGR